MNLTSASLIEHVLRRRVHRVDVPVVPKVPDLKERIVWYLAKQKSPVPVITFVRDVDLSLSYCRAVPNLIKNIPGEKDKILFGRRRNG